MSHSTAEKTERRYTKRNDLPGLDVVNLISGNYYVSDKQKEVITTILGSCVAACLYDEERRVGGMNHFLLPDKQGEVENAVGDASRYGVYAMEQVINGILKLGGQKKNIVAKVFGGANVTGGSTLIGSKNVAFIRHFLKAEGIPIASEDLGSDYPRRVRFFPASGRAQLLKLRRKEDMEVVREETDFARTLINQPVEGDIELF